MDCLFGHRLVDAVVVGVGIIAIGPEYDWIEPSR